MQNPSHIEPMVRIFCDFDGTIVPEDVGDAFFETFSGPEFWSANDAYIRGDLSAREVLDRHTAGITNLSKDSMEKFCEKFAVDPSFPDFVRWVEKNDWGLMILSDGLDAYIKCILKRYGLDIPFRSNQLLIHDSGRCSIALPFSDSECPKCGNCKRNHILTQSGDHDLVVYIGDGFSDFCAAGYADLVFAKGALESYCQKENISFKRFYSFSDIKDALSAFVGKRKFSRPRQVELRRQAAWSAG